jgi:SAM-dependent methyltransferase
VDTRTHWDSVYRTKRADEVSWFQRDPSLSRTLIARAVPDTSARIIDVGGGASSLVDGLLADGYTAVTVLDIAAAALDQAQARLGDAARRVTWLVADVLSADLPAGGFDLWHDRAVFHFLTDTRARAAYVAQMHRALRPGGHVVIATFAEDGPTSCSGLPVSRYSEADLARELGEQFELQDSAREQHTTPGGGRQSFMYARFQRR